MTMTAAQLERTAREREAFAERVVGMLLGSFSAASIYIGDRLGLYSAMGPGSAVTTAQLAERTGANERYLREWMEQQTLAGILTVENPWATPERRRYCLPHAHWQALADHDCLDYVAAMVRAGIGVMLPIGKVVEAFKTGRGVPFEEYGEDLREGQAATNRPAFMQALGTAWIPAMADVDARLRGASPARIADIGCGCGWSCIGMARAYPNAMVDGFDLDGPSVEAARRNVADAGLEHRVRIEQRDAGDPALEGQYHLVTALECVHDMSDPVGALRTMRMLAAGQGTVLVMDEKVREAFSDEPDDVELLMYGWSVLHCLPVGMADTPSAATGTVMRPGTLRKYASMAGFHSVDQLSIDNPFFRFYRLNP